MNNNKISLMDLPGHYQLLKKEILPSVKRVLESGRYILGSEVEEFEKEFAKYCKASYCIGVSSGTEALFVALKILGVGPGDEVVTVPNTFTATSEVIALLGAKVIFCDIDPKTMVMDPKFLKSKITSKTKAVIPVHLHGNPVDMDEVFKITKQKKIKVIEDAAQAHGAIYKGKIIGSLESEFTCFSFHPVKNLGAVGDAGAIVTNNPKYVQAIRTYINHGRKGHNKHISIGNTSRLDSIQAAVLRVKLRYLNKWIKEKERSVEYYEKYLPSMCETIQTTENSRSGHHVFAILVDRRDELAAYLKDHNIETGMHYPIPLHLQEAYSNLEYIKGDFPIAESYAARTLSLPLYPHITHKQINRVINAIKSFYGSK